MPRFIICPLNIYQLVSLYETICISFSRNSLIIKSAIHEFLLGSLYFFFSFLSPEDWPVLHKAILLPALAVPFCLIISATCGFFTKHRLFSSPKWSLGIGRLCDMQSLVFFGKAWRWGFCLNFGGEAGSKTVKHWFIWWWAFQGKQDFSWRKPFGWVPARAKMGLKSSFQFEGYGTQSLYHLLSQLSLHLSHPSGLHGERRSGQSPLLSV